jgi:8-amino-3,8-dideoxy-alpha-D-manno-octulosonate transaminase
MKSARPERLAILGGPRAVAKPLPAMLPGAGRIGREEERAVLSVLRSKRLARHGSSSSQVRELERRFARRLGVPHALAVNSGASALACALIGLEVGAGDEVLIPAYAWITTAAAVRSVGAVPVLAEVDDTLTLDVADVERKTTPRTKAVVAVHMRGAPCRMDALGRLARRRGLKVLEDVAQAAGGSFRGRPLGGFGDAAAFSFQQSKLVACGEGGLVASSGRRIYARCLSHHDGSVPPIEGDWLPGLNLRMTELEGAVALAQLARLDRVVAAMRRRKKALKERLVEIVRAKGVRFRALHDEDGDAAVALIMLLPSAPQARLVAEALRAEGVGARVLFDHSLPDLHVYRFWTPVLSERGRAARACPATLDRLGRAVHLDVSPELTAEMVDRIAFGVRKVFSALL